MIAQGNALGQAPQQNIPRSAYHFQSIITTPPPTLMNKEKNHPTARHTILPAEWEPQSGITVMQDGHPHVVCDFWPGAYASIFAA